MRSKDKLEVTVREMPQFDNKKWVHVRHKQTGFAFIPSFEDLFRIIQAICFVKMKNTLLQIKRAGKWCAVFCGMPVMKK